MSSDPICLVVGGSNQDREKWRSEQPLNPLGKKKTTLTLPGCRLYIGTFLSTHCLLTVSCYMDRFSNEISSLSLQPFIQHLFFPSFNNALVITKHSNVLRSVTDHEKKNIYSPLKKK